MSLVAGTRLGPYEKKELSKVVDDISKNKKLDWKQLLLTGLGFVIKVL